MNSNNHHFFKRLKEQIAIKFLLEHSAPSKIEDWKGNDITLFQEDLINTVKGKVSEKWFYTYIKNEADKLPRIDTLNLLSSYVGNKNWHDFKNMNASKIHFNNKSGIIKKYVVLLILIPVVILLLKSINSTNEFDFCFIDATKNQAITNTQLDIKIIKTSESPLLFKTDSAGCFSYKTKNKLIRFVVQSPYHKTDTIVRHIDSNYNQTVELTTNDYALMLHYYTNGKTKDWKKHKDDLNNLFADDVKIYQLFQNNMSVELFTKDEFIRTLTIPTSTLKNIKILDKTFKKGKIVMLKFVVQ